MSFSRFALGFTGKRRVARLSDVAFRLWVSSIDHSREQLTDGRIEAIDLKLIPRGDSGEWQDEHIEELVEAGLWTRLGDNVWQIDDYLGWQDSAEKVRDKRDKARERMKSVRANKQRTDDERSRVVRSGRVITPNSSCDSVIEISGGLGGSGGGGEPEPKLESPPVPAVAIPSESNKASSHKKSDDMSSEPPVVIRQPGTPPKPRPDEITMVGPTAYEPWQIAIAYARGLGLTQDEIDTEITMVRNHQQRARVCSIKYWDTVLIKYFTNRAKWNGEARSPDAIKHKERQTSVGALDYDKYRRPKKGTSDIRPE
jgi:hypothetical protein